MAKSPLATAWYPAYEGNFTYGRSGCRIEAITIHHMGGVASAADCGQIFATPGRCGSSHYGIGVNGEIACYVDEDNTAWTNSNWDSNCRSVTIETSDAEYGGNWYVNDTTLNSLIQLVAEIARRNNLGTLVKGQNLTWHSMFAATECPGPYLLSKIDYIIEQANKINQGQQIKYEEIERKSVILNKDCCLWNLNFTNWGEEKAVKNYSKGTQIDNIVAIATHPLGSKYYVTEYSYINKTNYGFNVVDCDNVEIKQETPQNEPKGEDSPIILDEPKTPENGQKEEKIEHNDNIFIKIIKFIIELIQKIFKKES